MAAVAAFALLVSCAPKKVSGPSFLRVGIRPITSLDPVSLRDPGAITVARQIFEPLVRFDPSTLQLKPGGATRWEMLDAGARWLFHLRKGAKFHNGRAVIADDVRYSLNRLARKETGSELAFLIDRIVGHAAVNATGAATELEGLRAIDDFTIEVRLTEPWVDFPYVLTHPATAPIPKGEFEADPARFKENPIGSGPYAIKVAAKPGQDFSLVAFKGYAGKAPAIPAIEFLLYASASEQWKDLRADSLDIAEVPPGKMALARSEYGNAGFSPLAAGIFLGFNLRKINDVRLRKALSLSIDRNEIAYRIFEEVLIPASGLVPDGLPGHVDEVCGDLCKRDLVEAKRLVTEIFPTGQPAPVRFEYPSGSNNEAVARSIQADAAEAGLALSLHPQELTAFFDTLDSESQELFRLGWVAEFPSPDWFLGPLYKTGSPDNHTGFTDPEIDALISRARSETRRAQRLQTYREIERRMVDQLTLIPIGFFRNHHAASKRVDGFYIDVMGSFEISRMSLRE